MSEGSQKIINCRGGFYIRPDLPLNDYVKYGNGADTEMDQIWKQGLTHERKQGRYRHAA